MPNQHKISVAAPAAPPSPPQPDPRLPPQQQHDQCLSTSIVAAATYHLLKTSDDAFHADLVCARDWAAFFQALVQFAINVLPMLLPLFTVPDDPDA